MATNTGAANTGATGWSGIFPAITTQFRDDESLDLEGTAAQIERMVKAGCHGIIMIGTLGENRSLELEEKHELIRLAVTTAKGRVQVLTGVAENTTAQACRFAEAGKKAGLDGLMVLPAMGYKSDRRETLEHYRTVARATDLPIMVYNNPVAYSTDVTPDMFAELTGEKTIVAIKESSDDVRRLTDIVNLCGNRYTLFCGVDDLALESFMLGATGWVAGLVAAFPDETVAIWKLAKAGRYQEARDLYRWFMPMLHLDVSLKLVQYIKLAQAIVGVGSETVRRPRLALVGDERAYVEGVVRAALAKRPNLAA
ncbi:MAG: dihydrodipicolinate synthase family protein [Rhodospirillaceae bacterium]|nr:dihydrodipicolinate synthase family protein [Rhodospirillaceae bacterium]